MSKFTSTTVSHIKSYGYVKQVSDILLKYQVFQILSSYVDAYSTKALNLVETYPKLVEFLSFADAKGNQLLEFGDAAVAYPFNKVNSVLGKVNSFYLSKVDAVLPGSSPSLGKNEVSNFFTVSKTLYARSVDFVGTKYTSLKSYLLDTYKGEYSKSSGDNEAYKVSYSLVSSTKSVINDVNTKVLKPFKQSTSTYVTDVAAQTKNKADSLISDAKSGIKGHIDIKIFNNTTDGAPVSVPAVSASA